MSNYWDKRFLKHININNINYICEVGSRYGNESIELSKIFTNANILAFECNPNTINECKINLSNYNKIKFYNFGLGNKEEYIPFYPYIKNNVGASSFLKRIDFNNTQEVIENIQIRKLSSILKENNLNEINLLCLDVQGYELEVLKGCDEYLKNINYIIMEEPKPIINKLYLPDNNYSKYLDAPSSYVIKNFMNKNNFIEIERIEENKIEDNVLYKNNNII
jgi:FkbM family methyltransferase